MAEKDNYYSITNTIKRRFEEMPNELPEYCDDCDRRWACNKMEDKKIYWCSAWEGGLKNLNYRKPEK